MTDLHQKVHHPPSIGIDFGTSKCITTWFNHYEGRAEIIRNAEGAEKTTSVVYFDDDSALVGQLAEDMLEDTEHYMQIWSSIKRDLAGPGRFFPGRDLPVEPIEAASEIFRKLKNDVEHFHFHEPVERTVVTHPATFTQTERDHLEQAAREAGFTEVGLLEEPVAAAVAFAEEGLRVGESVLVYDLGAGTFDLTLLVIDPASGGFRLSDDANASPDGLRKGGDDFDRALYTLCDEMAMEQHSRHIAVDAGIDLSFLRECRKRKENLSAREHCRFSSLLPSSHGAPSLRFSHELSRNEFERCITPIIEETVQLTRSYLERATGDGRVDSVLLIGGSSRIPLIDTTIRRELDVEPIRWQKQDIAVALGAAYWANHLWGDQKSQDDIVRAILETAREHMQCGDGEAAWAALREANRYRHHSVDVGSVNEQLQQHAAERVAERILEMLKRLDHIDADRALQDFVRSHPECSDNTLIASVRAEINACKVAQKALVSLREALSTGDFGAVIEGATGLFYRSPSYVDVREVEELLHAAEAGERCTRAEEVAARVEALLRKEQFENARQALEAIEDGLEEMDTIREAIWALERAATDALVGQATEALDDGDREVARDCIERLVAVHPGAQNMEAVAAVVDRLKKAEMLAAGLAIARKAVDAQNHEAALDALDELAGALPEQAELPELLDLKQSAKAGIREQQIEQGVGNVLDAARRGELNRAWDLFTAVEGIAEDHPMIETTRQICQRVEVAFVEISAARRALQNDQWSEAKAACEAALQKCPELYPALLLRAELDLEAGAIDNALQRCAAASKIAPDLPQAHVLRGRGLNQAERHQKAIEACSQAIGLGAGGSGVLVTKGRSLLALKKHRDAVMAFDAAIKIDGTNLEAWLSRGEACEGAESWEHGLETYRTALSFAPGDVDASLGQARCLEAMGRFREENDACEEALTAAESAPVPGVFESEYAASATVDLLCKQPAYADVIATKAKLHIRWSCSPEARHEHLTIAWKLSWGLTQALPDAAIGRALMAEADYRFVAERVIREEQWEDVFSRARENAASAVELGPDSAYAWYVQGLVTALVGDHESAITAFDKATELSPDLAVAWEAKYDVLRQMQAPLGEMTKHLVAALRLFPRRLDLLVVSVWVFVHHHLETDDGDDQSVLRAALKYAKRATKVASDAAEGWCALAAVAAMMDQGDEARRAIRMAFERDPRNPEVWLKLAAMLRVTDHHPEALDVLRRFTDEYPGIMDGWVLLGDSLLCCGRNEKAVDAYERVLKSDRANTAANLGMGWARLKLGEHAPAWRACEMVLHESPELADGWLLKAHILAAQGKHNQSAEALERAEELNPEYSIESEIACPRCGSKRTSIRKSGSGRRVGGAVLGAVSGVAAGALVGALTGGVGAGIAGGGVAYGVYGSIAGDRHRCRNCGHQW